MKLRNIKVTRVCVVGRMNAALGHCIQEALVVATTEWRNVELRHGDRVFDVTVNDLLSQVKSRDGNAVLSDGALSEVSRK